MEGFGLFDGTRVRQMLGECVPDGETPLAGIHAVAKETSVKAVCGTARRMGASPGRTGALGRKVVSQGKFAERERRAAEYFFAGDLDFPVRGWDRLTP